MDAPIVFDRALVRRRLARAQREGFADFLLQRAAEDLWARLDAVTRDFARALDLGTPTGVAAAILAGRAAETIRLAPAPGLVDSRIELAGFLPPRRGGPGRGEAANRGGATGSPETAWPHPSGPPGLPPPPAGEVKALHSAKLERPSAPGAGGTIVGDEESLPFGPDTFDLAVSLLALQSANDLPGILVQVRRALRPDGLFLACLFGGDTLTELRGAFAQAESELEGGASPRVAPFGDVRALGGLLQRAGFALPVADLESVTVRYGTPFGLLADLRAMGLTSALALRSRKPLRRTTLLRMVAIYAERFADPDGRVRATFDMVWLSGWTPHESQQKPLQPGSARMRLADALGTAEHGAGETAREDRS